MTLTKENKMKNTEVETIEVAKDTLEAMAENIKSVKEAMDRLDKSMASERLVCIILKHENGIPMSTTKQVFEALRNIDKIVKVTKCH